MIVRVARLFAGINVSVCGQNFFGWEYKGGDCKDEAVRSGVVEARIAGIAGGGVHRRAPGCSPAVGVSGCRRVCGEGEFHHLQCVTLCVLSGCRVLVSRQRSLLLN